MARQRNILTELTLFAEAEQEAFAEVQIITLNEHLKELAMEQALKDFEEFPPLTRNADEYSIALSWHIESLQFQHYHHAKEYVAISEDSIRIAVNKPIINDSAIDYALSLLIQVETFTPGDRHEFGKRVTPCL